MNNNTLKKRRPFGHEDAPAEPVLQDPSSFSAPAHPPLSGLELYPNDQRHIIEQAASILNVPVEQLLHLNRNSYYRPPEYSPYGVSKRPRLSMDPMSPPEKSPLSEGSRLAEYFAGFSVCQPCSTCEPQNYGGLTSTAPYDADSRRAHAINAPASSHRDVAGNLFANDETAMSPSFASSYPPLQPSQPMTVQPSTRREGMVYPGSPLNNGHFGQNTHPQSPVQVGQFVGHRRYPVSTFAPPGGTVQNSGVPHGYILGSDERRHVATPTLVVVAPNQRPPASKRGPFKNNEDREKTAETRRIGSCIRCRMQRIRCKTDPDNKMGPCLTCQKATARVWRLPCLRYKVTDVKLFKPGQVKGYEWTRRWTEGIIGDISQWASHETKVIMLHDGYTNEARAVRLEVRRFIPQDGDALERTWVHKGKKKSVPIPPFAIANLDAAKSAYEHHTKTWVAECCKSILSSKDKFLLYTYAQALRAASNDGVDKEERALLSKALQLWMAIRLTTKSFVIVGNETLGMPRDIMDETSPLHGKIPVPPVMGAQIDSILIHQIQSTLRRDMLESLQVMMSQNKQKTWLTTYLIIFIYLHNVALLTQHDAGYAKKHGIKNKSGFAREDMVREYHMGANILLAYFHYCNKGLYPFSKECKEQDLKSLAALDDMGLKLVSSTRNHIAEQRSRWETIRETGNYQDDFYFISQMYEDNWQPRSTI